MEFQVDANLGHGQEVHLFIDSDDSGFELDDGIELVTTPELYPTWYNSTTLEVEAGTHLTYRYGVFTAGKFECWEAGDKCRTCLAEGPKMLLRDMLYENKKESPKASEGPTADIASQETAEIATGKGVNFDPAAVAGDELSEPVPLSSLTTTNQSFSERASTDNEEVNLTEDDGVIIVAHQLPVNLSKDSAGNWHVEWDYDSIVGLENPRTLNTRMRVSWVGTVSSSQTIEEDEEETVCQLLAEYNCCPIFVEPKLYRDYYHGFCLGTLWPIFHNVADVYGELPTRWWNGSEQMNTWSAYTTVNRLFADKVVEVYSQGDLVWVNDLHLLLLPTFLSRRLRSSNIGLFMHTPFPSSEIFRTLSIRADLLRGILSADHVGFHLYEYARHFLACCRRILGIHYSSRAGGTIGVEYNGRTVSCTICHIGIEPMQLDKALACDGVQAKIAEYRRIHAGKRVIAGVDRLERLKGMPLKLLAFERLLEKNPSLRNKVHFLQYGLKHGCHRWKLNSELHSRTIQEVRMIVDRLNAKFGKVVFYEDVEERFVLEDRVPVWAVADVMIVSSIREGVNLLPFEYVYTRQQPRAPPGVAILSEFSSCSRVLNGALRINPWKIEEIVGALEHALDMSVTEREGRFNKHIKSITDNSTTTWAKQVLTDLKRARQDVEATDYVGYGLGLGFRMMQMKTDFMSLEVDRVLQDYRTSHKRLLLFDFGGTLVPEETGDNYQRYHRTYFRDRPSSNVLESLRVLCRDQCNTVFILSGKEREWMEEAFGNVPGLGLVAEHGFYHHWPSSRTTSIRDAALAQGGGDPRMGTAKTHADELQWETSGEVFDDSWKDLTNGIMSTYTLRTNGAYIERKGSSLVWHYRDADPDFGSLQAKELIDALRQVLKHFPVEVLNGKDYMEVRPEGVNKGVMVDRICATLNRQSQESKKPIDFVFCCGDDDSDEFMFRALDSGEGAAQFRDQRKQYTCTVGKKPSEAKAFLNDVDEVLQLVQSMTKLSIKANRNLSMNDLHSFSRFADAAAAQDAEQGGEGLTGGVFSGNRIGANGSSMLATSMSMNALPSSIQYTSRQEHVPFGDTISEGDEEEEEDGAIFF